MTTDKKKKKRRHEGTIDFSDDQRNIHIELKDTVERPSIRWQRFIINRHWMYLYAISQGKIFLEFLVNRHTGKKIAITNFMTRREFEQFKKHKKMAIQFYEKYVSGTTLVPDWYNFGTKIEHDSCSTSTKALASDRKTCNEDNQLTEKDFDRRNWK